MVTTDIGCVGSVCESEVAPEAAAGGPLALLRDGDTVTIDLDTRRCDVALSDAELAERRAAWHAAPPAFDRGWLQIYRRNVGPLNEGAVLVRQPPAVTP